MMDKQFTIEEIEWAEKFMKYTNGESPYRPGEAPTMRIWCKTVVDGIREIKMR